MGALTLLAAAAIALDPVAPWQPLIAEAPARCGVPEAWIARVMRAESGGRTTLRGAPIRSSKGAMGLMQLMPGTWTELRRDLGLGSDPHDPRDNIVAGACYLRRMHDRFGYPGLFAAYNAGPGRYAAWLAGRSRLPGETVSYLAQVSGGVPGAPAVVPDRAPPTLFAMRRDVVEARATSATPTPLGTLFAVRRDGE